MREDQRLMRAPSEATLVTWAQYLTLAFVFALAFSMWLDLGTGDVALFVAKVRSATRFGAVADFSLSPDLGYPPLACALLAVPGTLAAALRMDDFAAFKLFLLVFHVLATGIIYAISRSLLIAIAFAAALTVSAMQLGYLDILCAPFIFMGLWLMREDRPVAGLLFYTVAILIKWQPLIIAPFIVMYAFRPRGLPQSLMLLGRRDVWITLGMLAAIVIVLRVVYGHALAASLSGSTQNGMIWLAPNGLNLPFLCGMIYRLFADPATIPLSIRDGIYIRYHPSIYLTFRSFFALFYVALLLAALCIGNDRKRVLLLSIGAFWSYVTLSTGVHENHLAVAVFVSFFAVATDRSAWPVAVITAILFNFNLLLFYSKSCLMDLTD